MNPMEAVHQAAGATLGERNGVRILLHIAGGVTIFSGFGEIMREKEHKHLDRLAVAGHAA